MAAGYPKSPVSYPWHLDSRGKRSLAIDLKNEKARAAFDRIIACADVLITNYPLAARTRLRLDYDDVAKINPRLIYASFTGYGETGPDADQVGFDLTAYFARSGILDGARYDGAAPAVTMPAQGDRATGLALATGIMLALWNRERTGRGTKVASSLLANGIWANGNVMQAALIGATLPKRPPPERPRSALTNTYRTSDDRWIQFTVVKEDRDWKAMCRAIAREDLLADARFCDTPSRRANAGELAALLRGIFEQHDFAHWRARLKAEAIPFAPISPRGGPRRRRAGGSRRRHRADRACRDAAHHRRAVLARRRAVPPPGPGPALGRALGGDPARGGRRAPRRSPR